jgi:predicted FMN-binding regulatory protein PaiB
MSQNQPEANRRSVVAGLSASPNCNDQRVASRIVARAPE